ncbi:hypothetical protein LTR56_012338 [Elasticomyces elasticus]|nr:hypothetical protein LTR56_012338 [Elasticomyces elasticus]KAK3641294.1 hypothetical protein LTR22_016662 [Elasticomyces elasticus]KAK4922623.1 hypothetical protein LTR49_010150 [Elasticomyces elasticus]KAK5760796.1 hypothetical protein LTS12_009154 [Elasticomyces elasticus]
MGQLCSGTEREMDALVSSDNLEEKNQIVSTSVRAINIQSEALQQPPVQNSESAQSRDGAAEEINPIDARAERRKAEELLKELQERRRQWPRMPPNSELSTPAPPAVPLDVEHLKDDRIRIQNMVDASSLQIAENERKIAASKVSHAMMERCLRLVHEEIARREAAV